MGRRIASIDIGTNTVRLLVADAAEREALDAVAVERAITRLGGGYSDEAGIASDAMERTVEALRGFAQSAERYGVEEIRAVATSVVRCAINGGDFVRRVRDETGIDVSVIDGKEEARLSTLGVLSILDGEGERFIIIDIGGGSSEYIAVERGRVVGSWSLEMGVVHLTERHLRHDPPGEGELRSLADDIKRSLKVLLKEMEADGFDITLYTGPSGARFVGTAGTVTTIAAIDGGLSRYSPEKVNNYRMGRERVEEQYHALAARTLAERRAIPALEKGREDLIIAGIAITVETMKLFAYQEMTVSDSGLLEGVLIDTITGPIGR